MSKAWVRGVVAGLLFSAAGLAGTPAGGASTRCVFRLDPEIDCPACEDGIKRTLMTARGVQSAEIDVLNNRITVVFDPARVNARALIGRIKVIGYTAIETTR